MAKIEGRTSMKYPQFHQIPKDARIRILTGCDDEHFYATPAVLEKPSCPICDELHKHDNMNVDDKLQKAFAPFPVSSMYSYDQMNAMNRLRQRLNVNAIEIKYERVPTPIRKKKSWLRYSSNKKWARSFKIRYRRAVGEIKTLTISKEFSDKLKRLQERYPVDAKFLDGIMGSKRRPKGA